MPEDVEHEVQEGADVGLTFEELAVVVADSEGGGGVGFEDN